MLIVYVGEVFVVVLFIFDVSSLDELFDVFVLDIMFIEGDNVV